ncbi:unnamed protein product [Durusdinium trenchii]|uniref:Activator of Hsp90 ATPase AHSA1-like N-terminal domain-containing protein n=1 Tax=Durusdinium trenchii TaxID=1381693 RepID=A0ABP0SML1_9DINO
MAESKEETDKKGGYTYWKRDIDDAHLLPDTRPQKIDGATQQILTDESFALLDEGGNKVQGFNATVTGDSQAYHIRGRSRLGYEFKVKLSWKGSFGGKEVSGELDIQDLDSSDLDGFDVRPKPKNADSKSAAEALKKGARPAVKKAAEMLSQRLLARSG